MRSVIDQAHGARNHACAFDPWEKKIFYFIIASEFFINLIMLINVYIGEFDIYIFFL